MPTQFENTLKEYMDISMELMKKNGSVALRDLKGISNAEFDAIYDLGVNLYNAGKLDDAEKVFQGMVLLDQLDARSWLAFGGVAQRQRKFDEAIRRYAMAAFLDLNTPDAAYYSAECFLMKKDYAQARYAAMAALEYAPEGKAETKSIREKALVMLAAINSTHPELAKADEEEEKQEA